MLEVYEISREILHNFTDISFSQGDSDCPMEAFRKSCSRLLNTALAQGQSTVFSKTLGCMESYF